MKFYIKQKVFSIRDKFKVLDENQNEMYQVGGKLFSIGNKMELLDMDGNQVLNSKAKILTFMPTNYIFTPDGDEVATIKRKFGFKPNFTVEAQGRDYRVEGSFWGHSFGIFDGDKEVASISKKVISWGDTYEIDILDSINKELFLYIVIIIDQVIHENKKKVSINV
jgi:uncharacterized protein YxjI